MPGDGETSSPAAETNHMTNLTHMTTIPLPGKFKGANSPQSADDWPKCLADSTGRVASGLNNKPEKEHVSTLLIFSKHLK